MLEILIGLISTYAAVITVAAAGLYGQQRMMNKMTLETKRDKRREVRRSSQYLEALMQKTGTALHRRERPDIDANRRPSRSIVTPSMLIDRQREQDAVRPAKLKLEPVPPAIKAPFLRDAASNGAAQK